MWKTFVDGAGSIAGSAITYTWNNWVPTTWKEGVYNAITGGIEQQLLQTIRAPEAPRLPDTNITPTLAIQEIQDGINALIQNKQIPRPELDTLVNLLNLLIQHPTRIGADAGQVEHITHFRNLLTSLIPIAREETALVRRNGVAAPPTTIPCRDQEILRQLNETYKPLFEHLAKTHQRILQRNDPLSPVVTAIRDRVLGESVPSVQLFSEATTTLHQSLLRGSRSNEILIKEIKDLIQALDRFREETFSGANPHQLTTRAQSHYQYQLQLFREFLLIFYSQLAQEPLNTEAIPITRAQIEDLNSIPSMRDPLMRVMNEMQSNILGPLQRRQTQGGMLFQMSEGAMNSAFQALDASVHPAAELGRRVIEYFVPKAEHAAPKQERKSKRADDYFQPQPDAPEADKPAFSIPGGFAVLAPFFQPFLQAFSADGGGLWGGISATAAYPAVSILKSMIKNLTARGEIGSAAMMSVMEAKAAIEATINGKDQSLAAYQTAFNRAWSLCTQFPILLEGFELPTGLKTEDEVENPLQQLQKMAQSFKQNHGYLDIPAVKPEQTNSRIDRVAQTGSCFGTYQLCAWALGSPDDLISFHEIIIETKAMNEEERKEYFLKKLGEAIDANITCNVIVRWIIRIFLPVIYWFSTLFSQNLTHGLKHYFREVVIPSIKKDANKRLHSASIGAIGHCLDDLNKMMGDFIKNPTGSAWNFREHIRNIKDDKIYNGERTADELYDEFGDICVEEIMPKITWSETVGEWEADLGRWVQEDDHIAVKILKESLIFPVRLIYWTFRYVFVAPTQMVMQSLATWGAKKAFVETKAVKNIMQNVKTTRFEETPYVPVLDVLARWLEDIRQAQERKGVVDPDSYRSDPENQKTIKEFLDRAFRFVEMWNTNSREDLQKLMNGPSGIMGAIQEIAEGALLPPIQNALVGLIELVQSIATEETQLERFLFELCEIAENALTDAGRELSPKENRQREQDYHDVKKLIECTLNAILWVVCIEATSDLMKSHTVETAKKHIFSLKKIFLGIKEEYPRSRVQSAMNLEEERDDANTAGFDETSIRGLVGTLEEDFDLQPVGIDVTSEISDSPGEVTIGMPPILSASDTSDFATDDGIIADWSTALNRFLENPRQHGKTLEKAYNNCFRLTRELEKREVELNVGAGGGAKLGSVTKQKVDEKTSPILEALSRVNKEFSYLHLLYSYYGYQKSAAGSPIHLLRGCIETINAIREKTKVEEKAPLIITLHKQHRTLVATTGLPVPIAQMGDIIEKLLPKLESSETHELLLDELEERYEELEEDITEANRLFGVSSRQDQGSQLFQRVAGIQNELTALRRAVAEASYVEFLEFDLPSPIRALGKLALSSLQQTLYQQMAAKAKIFIDALCNGEVFEILIRNMAIRPLVESVRGTKKPSYTKG